MDETKSNILVKIIAIVLAIEFLGLITLSIIVFWGSDSIPVIITWVIFSICILILFGIIIYGLWTQRVKQLWGAIWLPAFFVYFLLPPFFKKNHESFIHANNVNFIDLGLVIMNIAIMIYLFIHFRKILPGRKSKKSDTDTGIK